MSNELADSTARARARLGVVHRYSLADCTLAPSARLAANQAALASHAVARFDWRGAVQCAAICRIAVYDCVERVGTEFANTSFHHPRRNIDVRRG